MRYLKILYVQVLIGIALGIAVGHFYPALGASLEPLGVGFVNLIKMAIAPIIFVGVVSGIAHMSDMAKFGRVGVKTLLYFEVVSTLALAIGLIVAKIVQPGHGFSKAVSAADLAKVQDYAEKAEHLTIVEYLMNIIPKTFVSAFTDGNLLQVLLIAILTGFACARLGEFGAKVAHVCDDIGKIFFSIIHIIVKFAPIGAFGAMAFTIGKYGVGSLVQLGTLIGTFYITALAFVFLVLGAIAAFTGFSIVKFLAYIREELLIVLGTSSSESVLPQMMAKLQRLGAAKPVVGLVIPTGYSFNLDGTNIYMTLAVLFLAQATNTHLTLAQELTVIAVAMLTSKGASGVTGAGFITLTATLTAMPGPAEGGHLIPLYALTFIFGIDRFMSECRALTNLVGNGVATLAVARWEGELDRDALKRELNAGPNAPAPAATANAAAEPD